jgi:large subunit ribosomal protein L15
MHRRLPKRGFTAPFGRFTEEVRLSDLERMTAEEVDLLALKAAGVISDLARNAKVILSGTLTRKVTVTGMGVTAGAKAAIEAAGGTVVIPEPAPKVRKLPPKAKRV